MIPTFRLARLPSPVTSEAVRAILAAIGRSTPTGRRDYAMLLMLATYGPPEELVAFVAEDALGLGVDVDHRAFAVHDDDGIGHRLGIEKAPRPRVSVHGLHPAFHGWRTVRFYSPARESTEAEELRSSCGLVENAAMRMIVVPVGAFS